VKGKRTWSRTADRASAAIAALVASAKQQRDETIARLQRSMADIEREIASNEGIYSHNKGRVTQAEVLRRARVGVSTLQSAPHKNTTRTTLNMWLADVGGRVVRGHKKIRRTVAERADAWRERYDEIAAAWAVAELEFIDAKNEVTALKARISELERERDELRESGSDGRVVPIDASRRRK
jgi:hypothetical protein